DFTIKRKAQMRAAIVERENTTFVMDDEYRSMRPVHDQPPLRLQLLEAAGAHEIRRRYVHQQFLPTRGRDRMRSYQTSYIGGHSSYPSSCATPSSTERWK